MATIVVNGSPLDPDARRSLALVLTDAIVLASPRERSEFTSVRFAEYRPEARARGGILASDDDDRTIEVDVRSRHLGRRARKRFLARALASLADAYELDLDIEGDRRSLIVTFFTTRPERDVTIGGRCLSHYEWRRVRAARALRAIAPGAAIVLTGFVVVATAGIALLGGAVVVSATIAAVVATFFNKPKS